MQISNDPKKSFDYLERIVVTWHYIMNSVGGGKEIELWQSKPGEKKLKKHNFSF